MDPVSDPLLLRKSGSAGDRTRDLSICSQKLWPLDYRGGPTNRYVTKKIYSIPFLAASNQVQARRPAHRMLGRSGLNVREQHNLDTRRPNLRQPSSRPKRFKEYRLEGAPNYQPARGAKLLACPGCPPCLGPALISTVIYSRVKTLQTFPQLLTSFNYSAPQYKLKWTKLT